MHFKSVFALFSGSFLAQLVTFGSSPYLSRVYSPDDFGIWAVFNAMIGILTLVAAARYELAIVLPATDDEAKRVLHQALSITSIISVLILFILLVTSSFWADFFKIPNQPAVFVTVALMTFFFSGTQCLLYWNTRKKNFALISSSRVIQSLGTLGCTVGFAFSPFHHLGLILGACLGQALSFAYLVAFFGARQLHPFEKIWDTEILKKYSEFPVYTLPGALLDTVSLSIPSMLTSRYFGLEVAGQYAFAYRMISTPLALLHTSLSQVFFQSFSQSVAQPDGTHKPPRKILLQTWGLMAAVILVPLAVTWLFGPELFSWIFGKRWNEAGQIAALLSPLFFFFYVSAPTSVAYFSLKLQRFSLYFGILGISHRTFSFWWGYQQGNFFTALKIFSICEMLQLILHNSILWVRTPKR